LPRPRLGARLDEGSKGKLTLVSAPAGCGKTTALSAWLAASSDHDRSSAWLSLDPTDNDPARFWRYVIAAVERLHPDAGGTAVALLGSPQLPPGQVISTTLLNGLAELPNEAVLVLDDYHAIESRAVHEALAFFVEHLPPRMHVVISTRADPPLPLGRLRARGDMAELRAAELRFTREEAATLFDRAANVRLSARDIEELERRTEGWVAGLQLAALAMQDRPDASGFVASFAGTDRHVVDYLAEEVLGRQPEHVQSFLLRTSVLDRMCAPLCDEVTAGDEAQEMLEHLEHANLFVVPLDGERRWYRYHHLFADVLRQRLSRTHPDIVPALHTRASGWFEEGGLVAEAVTHALAAGDWERAVRLIEAIGMTVVLGKQVQTMLGWVGELPEELVRSRPVLCTVHAIALAYSDRPNAAEARVRQAERRVGENPTTDEDRLILGRIAVIRSTMARFTGDLERCVDMAHRALELLPETETASRERAGARVNATFAFQVTGDVSPANERLLVEAVASSRTVGDAIPLLRSINFLARLRTLQGRLRAAAATYEEAAAVASGRDGLRDLVNSAAYYVGLGDIHREWDDLDSAESHLERGMGLLGGSLAIDADVIAHGYLSLARLLQARSRVADALATMDRFANLARRRNFVPHLVARGGAARARLALMQGDLPAATRWAEASGLDPDDEAVYPSEETLLTLARVLLARGRVDPAGSPLHGCLRLLDRLSHAATGAGRMGSVIEILILHALAHRAQHESGNAVAALERALTLAEPEGYVRVFVDEGQPMADLLREVLTTGRKKRRGRQQSVPLDYVRRLLAAFEAPNTGATSEAPGEYPKGQEQSLLDPLTSRELQVLALLAEGLSNREIAARLFIEIGTVKGYVHSLLRKLEVDNRTKAVARARNLHLVS
jgi:LuxR family maltose regulon positive regulatory protein